MNLGNILAKLRKERGLNQRDFAESLGVSNGAVAMWETNKRQPDLEMLLKIARYYCVSIDYLLGNSQLTDKCTTFSIPAEDDRLLKYFHKINEAETLSEAERETITKFFPGAKYLTSEDLELLDYYHELSKKDQRWIMGQMIDLIKKADENDSAIPKAQGS